MTLAKASKRGFTLIELSVVILVLALVAATVTPRLLALRRGDDVRRFKLALPALAGEARDLAHRTGQSVVLRHEPAVNSFSLSTSDEQPDSLGRPIRVPAGMTVQRARVGAQEFDSGEFEVRFFADGTAQEGGIEFLIGGARWSFVVDGNTGLGTWREGELPASDAERWPAGDFEIRGEAGG